MLLARCGCLAPRLRGYVFGALLARGVCVSALVARRAPPCSGGPCRRGCAVPARRSVRDERTSQCLDMHAVSACLNAGDSRLIVFGIANMSPL